MHSWCSKYKKSSVWCQRNVTRRNGGRATSDNYWIGWCTRKLTLSFPRSQGNRCRRWRCLVHQFTGSCPRIHRWNILTTSPLEAGRKRRGVSFHVGRDRVKPEKRANPKGRASSFVNPVPPPLVSSVISRRLRLTMFAFAFRPRFSELLALFEKQYLLL
jgi:hypothetical protein